MAVEFLVQPRPDRPRGGPSHAAVMRTDRHGGQYVSFTLCGVLPQRSHQVVRGAEADVTCRKCLTALRKRGEA